MSEPSTPSAHFNSKICGKKIEFSENDKNLISSALSVIWNKTHKKVNMCRFENNRVVLSYLRNEGCLYFDLIDRESLPDIKVKILYKFFFKA